MRRVTEQYRALSKRHYTAPWKFEEKKKRFFVDGRIGVGLGVYSPDPGCVTPMELLGPFFTAHGNDKQQRVFRGVWSNRGMIRVQMKDGVQLVRCPYHSRSYALTCQRRATPAAGGTDDHGHTAIRGQDPGLRKVHAHEFRGENLVGLSGSARTFPRHDRELTGCWQAFVFHMYSCGRERSLSPNVACCCTSAGGNSCESYRLPFIHSSRNQTSRRESHCPVRLPGRFTRRGKIDDSPGRSGRERCLPNFPRVGGEAERKAGYISFFHDVLPVMHRDHAFSMLLQPSDYGRTGERKEMFHAGNVGNEAGVGELPDNIHESRRMVCSEDVGDVEVPSPERHCSKFDGGRFFPVMDWLAELFHCRVADRVVREN